MCSNILYIKYISQMHERAFTHLAQTNFQLLLIEVKYNILTGSPDEADKRTI